MEKAPITTEPIKTTKKSSKEKSTSRSSSNDENKALKEKKEKSELNANAVQGRWSKIEHDRFIEAIKKYGKDWKSVESYIESRSGSQIRSHAQKFFNRLIKKFEIDKTEVITFIQNEYQSAESSGSITPQKKKKVEQKDLENGEGKHVAQIQPSVQKEKETQILSKPKFDSPKVKRTENSNGIKENHEVTHSVSNEPSINSVEGENQDHKHKNLNCRMGIT